jgi:hypothetical protein
MTVPNLPPFVGEGSSELATLYVVHAKYAATAERVAK